MSRIAAKIAPKKLLKKIEDAIRNHSLFENEEGSESCDFFYTNRHILLSLNQKLQKDLSKIQFDLENFYSAPFNPPGDSAAILGLHTSSSGLTFLGCEAGGDWEYPIYFIIYWDGEILRSYIPNKGNYYNKKTKMAFGNCEKSDFEQGYEYGSFDNKNDFNAMLADIQERIVVKG